MFTCMLYDVTAVLEAKWYKVKVKFEYSVYKYGTMWIEESIPCLVCTNISGCYISVEAK